VAAYIIIYQYLVNNFQLLTNKLNGQFIYVKRGSTFWLSFLVFL